jgi:hypothetical protein
VNRCVIRAKKKNLLIMKYYFYVLIGLLPFSLLAQVPVQTIRGTVTEKATGSPIPGAGIKLTSVNPVKIVTTNENGEFRFENIPVGRHSLIIVAATYNPASVNNIMLTSAKELVLNIGMEETVTMTEEVVITSEKGKQNPLNEMSTVSARQFSFEESARYAGNINDVARMAQSFAGVGGSDDSRNDIIVRGNSPIGVLYRLEGVDIPNPNHFAIAGTTGGPISMLNNNLMANSDFMTSAFAAEYGNATSAVFDLKMRNGNNEKHEFVGQFGFNGAELLGEGPFSKKSKASYLFSYRYSTLEIFKLLGIQFGSTAVPKYQDLNFKLNFPHKKGSLSVFGLGGISHVDLLSKDIDTSNNLFAQQGENLYFRSKVGMVGVSHNLLINTTSFFKITVGATAQSTNIINDSISFTDLIARPLYRNNSIRAKYSLILLYNKKFSAKHLLRIGSYIDQQYFSLSDSVYQGMQNKFVTLSDFKGSAYLLQPYTQWQWRPTNKLTVNLGVHTMYYTINKKTSVEPRAGIKYGFGHNNSISLGYGLHSQVAPSNVYFKQLLLTDGTYARVNSNLNFGKAHHLVLGYDKILGEKVRLKTEIYYQLLFNIPVDVNTNSYSILNQGANFGIGFPDSLKNTGTGSNKGFELTFEKFFSKGYYYLLTVSLYDSKYKGSDGIERNTAFNGNYLVNVLGGKEFALGKKDADGKRSMKNILTLDVRSTVNGGQWYTPANENISKLVGQVVLDDSKAFSLHYPAYFRVDFKIGFKHNGKKTTQQWSVDLRNVTNHQNVFTRQFDPKSGSYYTTFQTGFLPVAQYRIEF